jgi:hypothetical protein
VELVDLVAGAHHRFEVEGNVVRVLALTANCNSVKDDIRPAPKPSAVGRLPDQPILGRIPIKPRDHLIAAQRDHALGPLPYICMKSAKTGCVRIGTWPKKSWNMSGSTM